MLVGKVLFRHGGKLWDFIKIFHGESAVCCKYQKIKLYGSLHYVCQQFILKSCLLDVKIPFPYKKL